MRSFRVNQLAGMFDVPVEQRARHEFAVEVPGPDEPWSIGAIVGPSGGGKSTVARHVYGDDLFDGARLAWPADESVLEGFAEDIDTRVVTNTLTSVGFSSPPDWLKPFRVLSNGQKFRAELARALLGGRKLVAFDEFTSVVDRTVAKTGAVAVEKAVRQRKLVDRFVAVTCHYDVIEWLQPDWVLDMATGQLARGLVRRPDIKLEIVRCKRDAWRLFKRHHYLDATIHNATACYLGLVNGEPVAFVGVLHTMGYSGYWRITRVVTLPDWQGVGIGTRMAEEVCAFYKAQPGTERVSIIGSHPAIVRHCERHQHPRGPWKLLDVKKQGYKPHGKTPDHKRPAKCSAGRPIVSFEYVGRAPNAAAAAA